MIKELRQTGHVWETGRGMLWVLKYVKYTFQTHTSRQSFCSKRKQNFYIKIHVYTEDYNKHFQINGDLLMLTGFHHIVRLDLRNSGVFIGQCAVLQDAERCKTRVSQRCGNTIPHDHKMNVPRPSFPRDSHIHMPHVCCRCSRYEDRFCDTSAPWRICINYMVNVARCWESSINLHLE